MRTVKLYHLIGVFALLFILCAVNLNAKDGVLIVMGIGVAVVLLLGVHLILDKQDRSIERIEKKIEQIAFDIYETKVSSNFQSGLRMNEQVVVTSSLEDINRMLNEIKQNNKDMSLHEIKAQLDKIQSIIEKISVKTLE